MIKVILHGCNGRMGRVLQNMISASEDMAVVAGIDRNFGEPTGFKLYPTPGDCTHTADVIIDFSHYTAVPDLLDYCVKSKTPVVIATTALDETCFAAIKAASADIPVFRSANMSLGINALVKALQAITPVLEADFSVEIIEKHHTKKVDSPSGTAILLADAVSDSCQTKKEYIYGRHSKNDQYEMTQLGIHAVRGGTIPGEHSVIFAGPDEVIELKHTAYSREIFGKGALAAARFIARQEKGFYSMDDLFSAE